MPWGAAALCATWASANTTTAPMIQRKARMLSPRRGIGHQQARRRSAGDEAGAGNRPQHRSGCEAQRGAADKLIPCLAGRQVHRCELNLDDKGGENADGHAEEQRQRGRGKVFVGALAMTLS